MGAGIDYFTNYVGKTLIPFQYSWLKFSPLLQGNIGVFLDDISTLLILVVTTISFVIHIYSQGYMNGDKGYRRFFSFLNLFTFSMLGLVLAPSLLQMFVFWELVGLSSFFINWILLGKTLSSCSLQKSIYSYKVCRSWFFNWLLVTGILRKGVGFYTYK
jgi:NADH-quinone oxidoreductase subunit L